MIKAVRRMLVLAGVAAVAVSLAATPASAHTVKTYIKNYLGDDFGFVEVSGAQHTEIAICDINANGVSVTAEFYYRYPGILDDRYGKISDTNGSASGCGRFTVPAYGYITMYKAYQGTGESPTGWLYPS